MKGRLQAELQKRPAADVRKAAVFFAVLILIAAAGLSVKRGRAEKTLTVGTAGKLFCFTEIGGDQLSEFLCKGDSETLDCGDMQKILRKLGADKTVGSGALGEDSDDPVEKDDFLFIYDQLTALLDTEQAIHNEKLLIKETSDDSDELSEGEVRTNAGVYACGDLDMSEYKGKGLEVITSGGEILYVRGETSDKITLDNAWTGDDGGADSETSAKNIRVLLKTNGYKSVYHKKVTVTSSSAFTVAYGEKKKEYKAKAKVTIKTDSGWFKEGNITITPKKPTGKLKVVSLKRGCGQPSYRGSLELEKTKSGIVLINELGVEEYLYAVVPSEMPTSYPMEALKAQAVCARSFACRHMEDSAYPEYGAHVDDSTSFQVYNNSAEDKNSIEAVKTTAGQTATYKGKVAGLYYFSTSCGHTTSDAVWKTGNAKGTAYFAGKYVAEKQSETDLTKEENFRKFIKNSKYEAFDSSEPWFRWSVTYSAKELSNLINSRLAGLCESKPEHVLVKNKNGKFVQKKIASVGALKSVKVAKRKDGGAAYELVVTGSKAAVKVRTENSIRTLLAKEGKTVRQKGGKTAEMGSLLPSSFFIIDKKNGKYVLSGGGFGHGIGMSQNAAKHMAEEGMSCGEILRFFYTGIELE